MDGNILGVVAAVALAACGGGSPPLGSLDDGSAPPCTDAATAPVDINGCGRPTAGDAAGVDAAGDGGDAGSAAAGGADGGGD